MRSSKGSGKMDLVLFRFWYMAVPVNTPVGTDNPGERVSHYQPAHCLLHPQDPLHHGPGPPAGPCDVQHQPVTARG